MSVNLQIHFKLNGQNYDVDLNKTEDTCWGIHPIIKDIFLNKSLTLSQVGKELKAKLWLAGARDINISALGGTHKIGLRCIDNDALINIPQIINAISLKMEEKYIFPDVAKMCTAFLQQQLQDGVYEPISDLESFAQALTADIRLITEDKHIFVFLNEPYIEIEQKEADFTCPMLINKSIYKALTNIGLMGADDLPYELLVGVLEEDHTVGFMDLRTFGVCKERNNSLEMKEDVFLRRQAYVDAVDHLKSVDTIIIDLRNNGGGDPHAVQLLCSLFIDEELPLNRIEWRTKEGPVSEDFNTLSKAELPLEKRLLNKKIYLLIGPKTFSAAEEFANNMKVLETATIVGELSGGGAHPKDDFKISDDITISIPIGKAINPIQEGSWEGVGIIPDYMVQADKAFEEVLTILEQ